MEQSVLTAGEVWEVASQRLREKNRNTYQQWFQHIVPVALRGDDITLGVSDDFFGQIVMDNYDDLIREALEAINGVSYDFKLEPGHSRPEPVKPAASAAPKAASASAETPARRNRPRWNGEKYTFDNFIVGDDNRHAYAAARAAAEEPGLYNPLFIYGSNGVGKTHLLQAIAFSVVKANPRAVVRSTNCDEILNEYYDLLVQHKSMAEFRSSLRDVDVLLIDDVHRLAKKVQMQEEFFNLFNTLYRNNKQIVLTSDRQPCEISDLDKRLSTRFESGMTSEIGMPEFETRMVILRMWRKEMLTQTPLSDEFLEFLAANISSSVRRLKGAFLRLATHASLSGNDHLTLDEAEELLHAQIAQESASRDVSIEDIQRAVAAHFGISIADLLGEKRTRNIAEPRMIAMALCRDMTKASSNEVGAAFGRNHATILHAVKQVAKICAAKDDTRREIAQLKRKIKR